MNRDTRKLPATLTIPATLRDWFVWIGMLVLLLLVALVYWPGLHGGFEFDDYPNIVDNLALHVGAGSNWHAWLAAVFSSPSSDLQRPLAMLTFAINHALTGLDPYWMKLTNLAIHLLNTVLVFGLVRALLLAADQSDAGNAAHRDRQALWVAAAWALNPINLVAVLLVVQRMESLNHTFVFAGLWLYLVGRRRIREGGRGWPLVLAGLIGGTALGVLVKESAALLPLYALAIEWALLGFEARDGRRSRRLMALYAVGLVIPACIVARWLLPGLMGSGAYARRSFSMGERLLTEGRVLVDYLHWMLLPDPSRLSLYHDDYIVSHGLLAPPSTLWALLFLAALLAAMAWLHRRRPLMALGIAWFFIAQLLTATVLPLELVYEHRNYFASLGVFLVVGDGLLRMPRDASLRRAGIGIAVALLALYAGMTALRAREWESPLRFALTEAAKNPRSPRATYNEARTFIILSDYQPGSPYAQQTRAALERAMYVPGASPLPEAAAIMFASRTHAPLQPEWWARMQAKLGSQPMGPQQTSALGSLVDCQMQHHCQLPKQDMVATFLAALGRGPNPEVMNIYGNYALNVLDDPALALRLWQDMARRAPNVVEYQVTLAKMYIASGRPDLAAVSIARIRQLGRLGQNERIAEELERLAAHDR